MANPSLHPLRILAVLAAFPAAALADDGNPYRLRIDLREYRLRLPADESVPGPARAVRKVGRAGMGALIDRHARAKGLDPALVHAVVRAESAYRPEAVSPKGAMGLMQVMPATGQRFGETDLRSPEGNLRAGTAYLSHLLRQFGDLPLALAAYNAGEGAVLRHGNRIPPYPETRAYVRAVLAAYEGPGARFPLAPPRRFYGAGMWLDPDRLAPYRLRSPADGVAAEPI